MLADPVGCRLTMDGRLSGSEALSDSLRHGSLPSCPEGHPSLVPAPTPSTSLLPPVHPESSGGPRRSTGGMSQHSGSLHAGTPRTPLSAEYAQALQRNSQRLLEAVASSASSGLGGSAENPVPLPEQETLMLPLAAVPGASPQDRVSAAAKAAAEAGQLPPEAEHEGPAPRLRPRAAPRQEPNDEAAAGAGADGAGADADGAAAAAGAEVADPCTCPPYAVKATCGKRPIMEDTYALCPNICELPMPPMTEDFADKLPQRIAVLLANGEPSVETGGGPAAARPDGIDAVGGATFGSTLDEAAALEKLHFFGVYDGHGGIQASQHCAARLHHHLSVCLREMAVEVLGHTPTTVAGECGDGSEPCDSWRPPVVPEVQFVSVIREGGAPLGGPLGGADDCLIAVAAAAAAAAEAGAGKLASVSSAPDVSPEDEAALRALSRESSGDERREKDGATAAAAADAVAAADADADEDAASADGSENLSMCGLLEEALRAAFLKTDEEFSADGTAGLVGSTAVCALVGTHRVWIANCGDSRAVLCRGGQAVQVTDDHKPEREDEAERVEKAGGQVLYWNGHRVMGVLAMSRAIGDHCLRPYVIPEPEITVFKRHHKDEILLLASDGLWDVMPNQEATDLAMRCIRRARDKGASPKAAARVAATILTKAAVDRGSRDNITVMVIDLSRASAGSRGADEDGDGEGMGAPVAPSRPAGGRLAAAAAAAEAAGATGRRPVPQRIIGEQPSVTAGAGVVPGAAVPPGEEQQQQQQGLRQHPAVAAQQPLTSEASITAAPKGFAGGAFGRAAASPFVAAPAEEEQGVPITAQRQGSAASPFSACNLAPFDGSAAPPGSS